ncbi:heavy metal translocating P-type ATPase [Bacillus lacus]|uniref:Copper-exporting P-type ATPase n=1 Tax=Metabacillus lacus TaxID=1983721 RepID=A0A7X2J2E5_9BACI|nr:heavy metal translocating P-type ATPase [Metabacillus lacus]MRX74207.1 heavy metal translocating P-type ATPase [Metabacillus lacus]
MSEVKSKAAALPIAGMTCSACAGRIERGLKKVAGVEEAAVNLALEKASVRFDPTVTNVETLKQKIETLGFTVVTEKAEFNVAGMTCSACSARIEKVLNKLEGVSKASVNLALERATVEYSAGEISPGQIRQRIEKLGYKATEKEEGKQSAEEAKARELETQKGTFFFSLILSLPLLWSMVSHFEFTSFLYLPDMLMNPWVQMALATPVQFIVGRQFYKGAYQALKNKSANMDVLVAMGTSAAYFYSIYLSIMSIGSGAHMVDLYFETSAVLITLIVLGKLLEAGAKGRSSDAIKKLMNLQAKQAVVVRNGEEVHIPLEEVIAKDILLVKPGEVIPVDGVVLEGISAIDESMLTGESIPADKAPGDSVIGSTVNKNGFLKIQAVKVGKETALARIIQVVEKAQGSKAPIQRIADAISGVFVPIVVMISIITFFAWFLWGEPGNFAGALEKMIAVLVIACPCALGLATPTSIMAGSGRAAEKGILFKGGEHLESAQSISTVLLDKTGTVTTGIPVLTDVKVEAAFDEKEFMMLAGSAEMRSEHPLAQAIAQGMKDRGASLLEPGEFQAVPGFGISAAVNGKHILIGTRRLMEQNGISVDHVLPEMEELESSGKTAMLAAVDGEYAGLIAVSDTLKETSKEAVQRLKDMGLEVVMITGDNWRTAHAIAKEAGIETVIAEVLPEEKAYAVKKFQHQQKQTAMVGDGINDAPALALADIGMAIGTGTDVAMETADITLIKGDLHSIADAIMMSKKTMRNIRQNLFWAFAFNTLGIPVAALGFLAPWLAGAAMAFSSVFVVMNALRLQRMN